MRLGVPAMVPEGEPRTGPGSLSRVGRAHIVREPHETPGRQTSSGRVHPEPGGPRPLPSEPAPPLSKASRDSGENSSILSSLKVGDPGLASGSPADTRLVAMTRQERDAVERALLDAQARGHLTVSLHLHKVLRKWAVGVTTEWRRP